MSETFTNKLTIKGQQKKAVAEANNIGLNITTFQVGDGNGAYYEPTESQTALKNTKYTGSFTAGTQSQIIVNSSAINEVLYKCFIPADVGGFTIRELGLFDNDGDLILICKLPAQDKFSLSSGLYQPLTFTPKIIYTNPTTSAVLTPTSQVVPTVTQVINMITEYAPKTAFSLPLVNTDGTISLEINEPLTVLENKLSVDFTTVYDGLDKKADIDFENVTMFDVINLGSITSNFTLTQDGIHKGNITASCALILPAVSAKFHNLLIDFTLASGVSLTIPSNISWNYSISPSLSNTLVNRFIFDTKDGGTTWKGYYAQFAGTL